MSDDLVGKHVRDYQILEPLGRSGQSVVYRARHVLLEEERALKVYASSGDRRLDGREARALNRIHHANVVRFHEYWEQDGVVYLALELLLGRSLRAHLDERGRLPFGEAVEIACQAARGLQAAHAQDLIHRSVAPDNLQLVPDDSGGFVVKVLGFSIARGTREASVHGSRQLAQGLEYASPEQSGFGLAAGEVLDARADVYGLGVVLYEMLTGELPVRAGTMVGYREMHTHVVPAPPSQHLAAGILPAWLDALVMRMLAKHRDLRPVSMEQVLLALRGPLVGAQPEAVAATQIMAVAAEVAAPPLIAEVALAVEQTRIMAPEPVSAPVSAPPPRPKRGELAVGDVFAQRYRIEGRLGEGGMGVVYRALDTFVDQPLALKLISPRVTEDHGVLERLKREVVLARRIAHPNACRTYDIGDYEGTAYVTMELIEGESLGKRLARVPRLAPAEVLAVARDVLQALAAAHALGIVHRDLKPDNIMLGNDGRIALMDFGLSVSADTRRVTRVGTVVGTPAYMTPEQIMGQDVDRRSDLYSLGVILFQLATGVLPYKRDQAMAVMAAHVQAPVPVPSAVWPEVPPEHDALIIKAMAKQREARFQSAGEFLAAVQALISPQPPQQSQPVVAASVAAPAMGRFGFVSRTLDGALRALGLRGTGKETQAARALVEQAQRQLESGDRLAAEALLERTSAEHPLIAEALAELRRRS